MKLSFKNGLHDCDKHLTDVGIYNTSNWGFDGGITYCSICGRIKDMDEYGIPSVINYKPKEYKEGY